MYDKGSENVTLFLKSECMYKKRLLSNRQKYHIDFVFLNLYHGMLCFMCVFIMYDIIYMFSLFNYSDAKWIFLVCYNEE